MIPIKEYSYLNSLLCCFKLHTIGCLLFVSKFKTRFCRSCRIPTTKMNVYSKWPLKSYKEINISIHLKRCFGVFSKLARKVWFSKSDIIENCTQESDKSGKLKIQDLKVLIDVYPKGKIQKMGSFFPSRIMQKSKNQNKLKIKIWPTHFF